PRTAGPNQRGLALSLRAADLFRFAVRHFGKPVAMNLPFPSMRVPKEKVPLIAALGLALLAGAFAYWGLKRKEADVRQGWNLVPVVVASRDLPEGTAVTLEMMMQRSIPEQFATTSVVKPDLLSLIENQRLLVPVQQGDPFLWTQFETTQG